MRFDPSIIDACCRCQSIEWLQTLEVLSGRMGVFSMKLAILHQAMDCEVPRACWWFKLTEVKGISPITKK